MIRRSQSLWVGLVLIAAGLALGRGASDAERETTASRLLGPFAGLASDATWYAAQNALLNGEIARAVVLAERAVGLAPAETFGWERYAAIVGTLLASPETEADPAVRLAWVRAALAIYDRGEAVCEDPAGLALARAVVLSSRAEIDPELPWEGGPSEPWQLAAEAFERAALAHPFAGELAERARSAADALR